MHDSPVLQETETVSVTYLKIYILNIYANSLNSELNSLYSAETKTPNAIY